MSGYWSSRALYSSSPTATPTQQRRQQQQQPPHSVPFSSSHYVDQFEVDEAPPQSPVWDMDDFAIGEQSFAGDTSHLSSFSSLGHQPLSSASATIFPSPDYPPLAWPAQESWSTPLWNPLASPAPSPPLNATNFATHHQPTSTTALRSPDMYMAPHAMHSALSTSPPSPASPMLRHDTGLEEFGASPSLGAGSLSGAAATAFAQFSPQQGYQGQYSARTLFDAYPAGTIDSQWVGSPGFPESYPSMPLETYRLPDLEFFSGITAESAYAGGLSPLVKESEVETTRIFGFATNDASSSTEDLLAHTERPTQAIPIPSAVQSLPGSGSFPTQGRRSPRREQSLPPRSPDSLARMFSGPSSMPNMSTMASSMAAKPAFLSSNPLLSSPTTRSLTAISVSAPSPVLFINQTAQFSTNRSSREAADDFGPSSAGVREARNRKRKRLESPDIEEVSDDRRDDVPTKSELRPPKQAPSMWQIYFADWLQQHKTRFPNDKLNVAQAAKEAGALYKNITAVEKEDLKRRVQLEKDSRERRLQAWQRTLTPDDIRRENRFRTAQRKAGLSRRANIKDPNAPKKPLSAYFMFLAKIRSEPQLVEEVFGNETETTRQSVLAAKRWREMSDEEKRPFLTQAEHDKLQYEAARKLYEDHTTSVAGTGYIVPHQPDFDVTASLLASKPHRRESLQPSAYPDQVNFAIFTPGRPAPKTKTAPVSIPYPTSARKRGVAKRHHNTDTSEESDSDDEWVPNRSS